MKDIEAKFQSSVRAFILVLYGAEQLEAQSAKTQWRTQWRMVLGGREIHGALLFFLASLKIYVCMYILKSVHLPIDMVDMSAARSCTLA